MSKDKPKSLSDLIETSGSDLGRLATAAALRTGLSDYLRSNMDDALAPGFMHCNIRDDGTLVILAASPAWANRLRYAAPDLLRLCRDFGQPATDVRVRVAG